MTCRATYRWLMTLLLATCALIGGPSYAADTTELKAKQIWQLLDYVAVDYGGAVANGAVLKASEYAEMQEFSATAERQLGELPDQTGVRIKTWTGFMPQVQGSPGIRSG